MARSSIYEVDVTYFQDIDTPSKAYWLGALAADGCSYYNRNKWVLQFIVSEKDQDWLLAFRNEIKSTHPIRTLPGGFGTPCCRLVITNQQFCAPLLAIGLKSDDILQCIPEGLYAHFIRGLFDGDGSIITYIGRPRHTGFVPRTLQWSLVSQSHDLLQSLQALFAEQCGIAPNKMRFHSNVWQWSIRGNRQIYRIAEYFYPSGDYPFLQRKRAGFEIT